MEAFTKLDINIISQTATQTGIVNLYLKDLRDRWTTEIGELDKPSEVLSYSTESILTVILKASFTEKEIEDLIYDRISEELKKRTITAGIRICVKQHRRVVRPSWHKQSGDKEIIKIWTTTI